MPLRPSSPRTRTSLQLMAFLVAPLVASASVPMPSESPRTESPDNNEQLPTTSQKPTGRSGSFTEKDASAVNEQAASKSAAAAAAHSAIAKELTLAGNAMELSAAANNAITQLDAKIIKADKYTPAAAQAVAVADQKVVKRFRAAAAANIAVADAIVEGLEKVITKIDGANADGMPGSISDLKEASREARK